MPITSAGPGSPFAVGPAAAIPRNTLAGRLALAILASFFLACVLLFVPAGSLDFWEAKAWLIAFFSPSIAVSVLFLAMNPVVLERRLYAREHIGAQRNLLRWFRPLFLLVAVLPGLDARFHWSDAHRETVPRWLALSADLLIVAAICFAGWVMHINAAAGRATAKRQVITAGPYSVIRHPLYFASLLLWLLTPVALGSWLALPAFVAVSIPFCVLRLRNEEKALKRQLPGYAAYCKRTPFRLIPFVW